MNKNPYEIVLCVGKQHLQISLITIDHIFKYLNPVRVVIITALNNSDHYHAIRAEYPTLDLYDEDMIIKQVSKASISLHLNRRLGDDSRAGWYFQQFLKLAAYKLVKTPYYLVWDADSIPLAPIHFFLTDSIVLAQPGKEHHIPYFNTLARLLQIPKQADHSFISEHLMISKDHVERLIHLIAQKSVDNHWVYTILEAVAVEDLALSGFSEYETYGNYMLSQNEECIQFREQKNTTHILSTRFGSQLFGSLPRQMDLNILRDMGYHYATFEVWDNIQEKKIRKNKNLAKLYDIINQFTRLLGIKKIIKQIIKKKIRTQINK